MPFASAASAIASIICASYTFPGDLAFFFEGFFTSRFGAFLFAMTQVYVAPSDFKNCEFQIPHY